jgi:hypothetical protein
MKITFTEAEFFDLVMRVFPKEMTPTDYVVESIESKSYPVKTFEITLEKPWPEIVQKIQEKPNAH